MVQADGLRALMECAKNVLISGTRCMRLTYARFAFLRSDLSCRHVVVYLRNRVVHSIALCSCFGGYAGRGLT